MLESKLTRSLVARLPQHSCIVVREFPAAGEERCEQGYVWMGVSETLILDVVAPEAHQNNCSYVCT